MNEIKTICSLDDLRRLEVINICNGKKLGAVSDVEMDLNLGCITAIILPKRTDFLDCFRRDVKKICRIPWCRIERIGDDAILVRIKEEEL